MEGFLTDLGKTFAEKLINGAIEKSRYVFCFKCIAKEFEEEKVKLEAERTTMRQRFRVAIEKDKEIQFNAQVWEERSDKLIQEDTKTKQRCFFGFCPNCIWRYKRGEELANKTEEIKKLMEKGEKLENVELARHLPDVERYSSRYYISFKSREVKYKELLVALKDDNNYTIGLHGMGGTGKTTLAKEVGKQLKTLKQFNHVIDTTVSFTPDIKKIQDDIAGSLGLEWGDINESDRPKKLWSRLTNGDKILVILDDVWGNLNFDDIGIPNSDNHKGCKVLVTTRDLRVCNKMGCGETIQLELLSKEDAWIMFKMHAHLSNVSSKSFLDKGYKITTECKRLPVAIATIASSLKGQKRLKEWDIVLKSLQKNVSMGGVDEDLVDIYKCLKFSYDYLKNEKAKRLFLLCSVFQEDEEMSIEILARLSIAVGLFGEDYCSYEDARSQAVVAKNKLLDSCLLLETENGEVKMHDLVREVAKWMANKEIQEVNLYNKNQQSLIERDKDVKYLLCEGNLLGFFSSKFDGSKLEILIVKMKVSYRTMDFPISFFENAVGLRVLNLKNKVAWHIRKKPKLLLPKSIQSLTNIRSLLVEEFNLGDISIFGSLRSLETLDLDHCQFDELPCEIIKLEKLRLLNLVHCEIRCNNPFDVIQKCSSLEELYFCHSFNEFCKEITLPSLGRYYLTDVPSVIMNDSLSKCVTIQRDYFSEATYKYVMQTTELLQLYIEKGWRNLMPEIVPIDQGMNDLIELRLKDDSQLQCLVDTKHIDSQVPNVFSKLVVLKLDEMENLEELCNGPISFDSLNNLEKLKIMYCRNLRILFNGNLNLCNLKTVTLRKCSTLVSVFDLSTSRSLLLLEKLEIIGCEKLENIVTYDNNKICCNSMFPKLKIVDIKRCHQLQFVIPLLSAKDLLLLESINIESCDKLNYIFGQHQDVKLTSLKELQLIDLPNFIDIFPESYHSTKSSSIEGSSNSISKQQTQLEPIKSNIFSWSHICYGYKLRGSTSTKIPLVSEDQPKDCSISLESSSYRLNTRDHADECLLRLSHVMCNIKKIRLMKLSKIKSVFILSIARIMSSLESLTIESCYELKNIVEDIGDDSGRGNIVFPKLKKLEVENCEKLEYIFGIHINASVHHQNHHINEVIHLHLPALESLELRSLPSLMGVCVKNYCTTFPPLTVLQLFECPQVVTKSIGDFVCSSISNPRDSTSTTIKDLVGNVEHFIALENLKVANSKLQSIFYLDEMNGQQINLGLQEIEFYDLLQMTYLFLLHLRIEQCDELKYIIEEDHVEKNEISNDHMSPIRTCFPKLKTLVVRNCNKLKYIFPASVCTELPELWFLMIRETSKLEKIFGGSEENDQIVEIPKLRLVVFVELPSFFQDQGIEFQTVEFRLVRKCQNLSLTSTTKTPILSWRIPLDDI
ncbi:putative CC-NBS-LRR resistance protein, partial [Trifolium pratense]